MKYQLRDYQQEASDAAIRFFRCSGNENGLLVLPTGAGKSLVIADIAHRLDGNVLVFQPSKENHLGCATQDLFITCPPYYV